MTDLSESAAPAEPSIWSRRTLAAAATLAVLVALSDVLLYPHELGINLTIFFLALTVGVLVLHPERLGSLRTLGFALVAVVAALPFVETVNLLWGLFALGAVSLLALDCAGLLGRFEDWMGPAIRFTVLAPVRLIGDGLRLLTEAGQQRFGSRLLRIGLAWLVPVILAAVFAALFVAANPVLEEGVHAIRLETLFQLLDPARVFIWGFVAVIAWPVLVPRLLRWDNAGQWQGPLQPRPESLVFGAAAIRNSLGVFNVLFAVQTLMDLAFLWGGVRLPDGITYAEYAHRGAYPLILTALLAAAFVLVAMRRGGPAKTSRPIRALVYLFVAQNVWLVVSSLLRLDLYVEAYGLTELRLYAGVWMLLVAVGLVLIVAKIALARSNRWLVMSNFVSLSLTLFAVSVADLPAGIAWYNVVHSAEAKAGGPQIDLYQMHDIGPAAVPALDHLLAAGVADPEVAKSLRLLREELAEGAWRAAEWQSWTWRAERLRQYVALHPLAPEPTRLDN